MDQEYSAINAEREHSFSIVEEEKAKQILQKSEIHGNMFNGQVLTHEILETENLLPKYKIPMEDGVICFASEPYNLHSRLAVTAFIEKDDKIVARSYYRSNSQGIWRYLPNYTVVEDGRLDLYGKGFGEESITLPIASQKAFSQISAENMPTHDPENPELIFAGTARQYGEDATYMHVTRQTPERLEGNFYSENGDVPPEKVTLSEAQSPDFSTVLDHWEQDTSLYGTITIEVFASKNGKLKYMFCKDSLGRAWIGSIENDSEIQSTGTKKTWINGGHLVTPAYEYISNITGTEMMKYGNEKMRQGSYVDMYEKYLGKVPIIQEYIASIATRHSKELKTPEGNLYRNAKNFEELASLLYSNTGVSGSNGHISADEITSIIDQVRVGTALIDDIPETGGLRARVDELDKIEKIEENR